MLIMMSGAVSSTALAQYFGRNKVQYETFEFKVLKTEHFDIYYYEEERAAAETAARMAERWYARLSRVFDYRMRVRQPLVLYASGPHFRQTNAVSGAIGEGTGGVTESFKRRIVLPMAASLADTDHVIGHELVHAFQYALTDSRMSGSSIGMPAAVGLPLWFIEGMAEYLSLGPVDPQTAMWIRDAAAREELPDIDNLDDPDYFPYRYGHAFWAYVAGRWGDSIIRPLLRAAAGQRGGGGMSAIEQVLGVDVRTLSAQWHDAIIAQYGPVLEATAADGDGFRALITDERHGGELNVGPELSPDGSKLVYLSERDLFSIDMFLADARTGETIRRLTSTAVDPHFDSLQFISSAGAWHPDGQQFAFAAIRAGQPVLTVVDSSDGETLREIALPGLDEAFNPSWSPDGSKVVFSALAGGFSDLFVYNLAAATLTRLTDDRFADLEPAWSPDGGTIAFVTERFTTTLDTLDIGELRLATIDPSTKRIAALPAYPDGKHINPQWSADGRYLYFIGAPHGIPNVQRLELSTGTLAAVTNLESGITGITNESPALSVARSSGDLAFTVYSQAGYNIYTSAARPDTLTAGAAAIPAGTNPAALPPSRRAAPEGSVAQLLADNTLGLPRAERDFPVAPYQPSLSLDYIGQPTVGVGVDPFGTYVGGGISAAFSDMLGNHQLGTAVQANGGFKDIGGQAQYLNRKHRWIWGLSGEYMPYRFGDFAQFAATIDGEDVVIEETLLERQTNAGVSAIAAYPISRAARLEVNAGGRHIGFDRERQTDVFSLVTGEQIAQQNEDLPSPDSLTMAVAGAALVYDTSVFGATSPILGRRYRFDVQQTAGSLNYSLVLADFRQYFMPRRPFTLAFRGLHFGRYGGDADDSRLRASYLGYPDLVRGYDVDSFDASECTAGTAGSCQAFDQLVGSRLLVGNAELRFPLWAAFGGDNFYGPLPIELAFFADAGVAWDGASSPSFANGSRDFVKSVGAAARVNLFGYAVAEIDYVRPLDRPGKGWLWQFSLRPGF